MKPGLVILSLASLFPVFAFTASQPPEGPARVKARTVKRRTIIPSFQARGPSGLRRRDNPDLLEDFVTSGTRSEVYKRNLDFVERTQKEAEPFSDRFNLEEVTYETVFLQHVIAPKPLLANELPPTGLNHPQTAESNSNHLTGSSHRGQGFQVFYGRANLYAQDSPAGGCGPKHSVSEFVVAVPSQLYENGKFCGERIAITRISTGKTLYATVVNNCHTCKGYSLGLSVEALNSLGSSEEGLFDISWHVLRD